MRLVQHIFYALAVLASVSAIAAFGGSRGLTTSACRADGPPCDSDGTAFLQAASAPR
jgi:hypothetical protein